MTRRPGTGVILGAAIVLLVAMGSGAWVGGSSYATSAVEVGWRGDPACTGTGLEKDERAIRAQEGMTCVVTVEVRNTGRLQVQLDSAILPYLGPEGGAVVRAGEIDGRVPGPAAPGDIDARLDLDHDLGPGETWTFRTAVVFRPDGCTSAGSVTFHDWPAVVVGAWGRDRTVASSRDLTFSRNRQNPGCRAG